MQRRRRHDQAGLPEHATFLGREAAERKVAHMQRGCNINRPHTSAKCYGLTVLVTISMIFGIPLVLEIHCGTSCSH